jgi:LCP family protein required for cell wall assembly
MNINKKPRLKIKNKKRFFLVTGIIATVLVLTAVAVKFYYDINRPENVFKNSEELSEADAYAQFDGKKINILFYGLDKNEYRDTVAGYQQYRADTIMVATIDLETKSIEVLSVPRDTYVDIYNVNGMDKINASFAHGQQRSSDYRGDEIKAGTDYLKRTVSELLGGIPIHFYIGITDMDVVNDIVDEIGGVEIDVLHTLYADKGKDRSKVRIEEGLQVLNGKDLQYYARYRAYPEGDIERVASQQHILKAVFDNMKKTNSLLKIPRIYEMVSEKLATDLSFKQISALALIGMGIDRQDLNTHTFPGYFGTLNRVSYWVVNESERVDIIKELYGIDAELREQQATSDRLISLSASVVKKNLNVGETTSVNITGRTADGQTKTFSVRSTSYSVSNDAVLQLNADGTIVAKGSGDATITFKVQGVSTSVSLSVAQIKVEEPQVEQPPVDEPVNEEPVEEKPSEEPVEEEPVAGESENQ